MTEILSPESREMAARGVLLGVFLVGLVGLGSAASSALLGAVGGLVLVAVVCVLWWFMRVRPWGGPMDRLEVFLVLFPRRLWDVKGKGMVRRVRIERFEGGRKIVAFLSGERRDLIAREMRTRSVASLLGLAAVEVEEIGDEIAVKYVRSRPF